MKMITTSQAGQLPATADAERIHALFAAAAKDEPAPERGRISKFEAAAMSLVAYNGQSRLQRSCQ